MRRAAKPQTGGIRHQNDCLVETSNFSSLSARGCERAASLLWPRGAAFPAFGGPLRQKGPEAGTQDAWLPRHNHTRKTLGGANDRGSWWKSSWRLFPQGPSVSWSPWQPRSPVEQQAGGPGTFAQSTFAARSEAHEALPLVALGFPEPPPRVRRGRDWRKKQQKKPSSSSFLIFFFFFQQKRKFEIQWESLPGKFGCGAKKPPLRVQSDERGVPRAGRGRDMLIEARIPRVSAGALGLRESCDLNATTVHPRSQPRSPTSVQATLSPAWNNF